MTTNRDKQIAEALDIKGLNIDFSDEREGE